MAAAVAGARVARTFGWVLLVVGLLPLSASSGEVRKERFGRRAADAAAAYQAYGTSRIGLLVVPTEESPDPGVEYGAWNLLTQKHQLEGDPHRMPERYELRLYEALRAGFARQGFQVQCLNRHPWQDLKLKEILKASPAGDAVCAAHYSVRRTRKITADDDNDWWSPFAGMSLSLKLSVYDAASGDLIHAFELESLGTERLFEAKTDMVAEEPLYPSGYDLHGSPNAYRIAIYNTGLKDLRKGQNEIPVIRTAKGSLDINVKLGNWVRSEQVDIIEMQRRHIPIPEDVAPKQSVLARLLEHVAYRPEDDDVAFYDLASIERCGQAVGERIPHRPGR